MLAAAGCQFGVRGLPIEETPDLAAPSDLAPPPRADLVSGPELEAIASGSSQPLYAVFGAGPSAVFVAGAGGTLLRSTDRGAHFVPAVSPTGATLRAGWAASDVRAWACGDGGALVATGDGTTWSPLAATPIDCRALWGSSAGDLWLAGTGDRLFHSTDAFASLDATAPIDGAQSFAGLWSTAAGAPTAAGYHKIVATLDGVSFTSQYDGPASWLAISGFGGSGVVVGEGGAIARFEAGAWRKEDSGTGQPLYGVWASAGERWAVGGAGTVLRSSGGTAWQKVESGVSVDLYAVWGSPAGELYVVGAAGTILRRP